MIIDIFRNLHQCKSDSERMIVANIVAAALAALSVVFSALMMCITYLWGWIGFTLFIGVCLLGSLAVIFGADE